MVGAAAAAAMAAPIGRTAQAPAPTTRRARLRPSSARLITRAWPISLADHIRAADRAGAPPPVRLIVLAWLIEAGRAISLADCIGPGYGQGPRPSAGLMVLARLMAQARGISLADQIGAADGRARQ